MSELIIVEDNLIYDLIYCPIVETKELLKIYPDAKIEDASDFVHDYRFSIQINDTEKNYLKNIIKIGLRDVSFNFQMSLRTKEKHSMLDEIIDELKFEG